MDPTEALEYRNRSADSYLGTGEQKLFELWYDQKKTSSDGVSSCCFVKYSFLIDK